MSHCRIHCTLAYTKSHIMEAIQFVSNYELYIDEILSVIKPELYPIAKELRDIDPHDLIRPDAFLNSESHARGIVWSIFMSKVRKFNEIQF